MLVLGVILALAAFLLVAATLDGVLGMKGAGLFTGVAAGAWTIWPFLHHVRVGRYNFLHPVPREYSLPVPQVFAKIRDLLAEFSYNFGDKWHVVTADTQSRRITANLRFVDKETNMDVFARGGPQAREERLQRFLELIVQMESTQHGGTIVQLDFYVTVEGAKINACDSIVAEFCDAVEECLGPGTDAGSAVDKRLPAPPWWLVAVTVVAALLFMASVGQRVFAAIDHINTNPQKLDSEKKARADQLKRVQDELDAWQKFKEANGLK